MTVASLTKNAGLLAACLIAVSPPTSAAPGADANSNAPGAEPCKMAFRGPPGPPMGPGPGRGSGPGPGQGFDGGPPPYLMELNLSEEQQDKVFAIQHAAAPTLREQAKAAHKAHDALHHLGQSTQWDAASATNLAQAAAKAESQFTLTRIRTDHDIYLVLTAEQQAKLAEHEREHEHEAHGHEPPPR